jgi:UrcA family protein
MRKFVIAAVAAASLVAGFGVAQAEAPVTRRVSVAKVDFTNPEAVKAFHQRLERAAREACSSGYIYATQMINNDRTCAEDTLADAVSKVDRPLLTAMQQQRQQTLTARGY